MNILVVEDDRAMLQLLETNIRNWGYDVRTAQNGQAAWESMLAKPSDIVVTDWVMAEMDGLQLCERIREAGFEGYVYVILISAQDSLDKIEEGLRRGVDDYVTKPFNLTALKTRIAIGERIIGLERDIRGKYEVIHQSFFQTIQMFSNLLEIFNEDLGGHCRRVAALSLETARRHPRVMEDEYPAIEAAGLLHDIGMVGFPPDVFTKKSTELTGDEKKMYRSHPEKGEIILKDIAFLGPVAKTVGLHHEKFNGEGFPNGIKGKDIPLSARIVGAATIYDRLINRWKTPREEIPEKIHRLRGYDLDPEIADILLHINHDAILEEERRHFSEISVGELKPGMILAANIRGIKGALVMPANKRLSDHDVEKLIKFRDLDFIGDTAFISKAATKG